MQLDRLTQFLGRLTDQVTTRINVTLPLFVYFVYLVVYTWSHLERDLELPARVIHDRGREVQEYGNCAQVREPGSDLPAVQQ